MIKFMVMFRQPENAERFENTYQDFLALVERIPDIRRRQVVHGTGSPGGAPMYYRILEIYFDSQDIMEESLKSDAGQEAGAELYRLPKDSFELLYGDVYEEDGGSTPTAEPADAPAESSAEPAEEAQAGAVKASSAD
ncbi:MAG: EthD family reductase [Chloroflexi bacterium]|nr:EthD family reductase [Chloroflexota bacterium]